MSVEILSIPDATDQEKKSLQSRLQTQVPAFISDRNVLAIFAFGGTLQSAYIPSKENILPISINPAFERIKELNALFGIAESRITGSTLIAKDSRQILDSDIALLVHSIREIPNERIVVTCGTYMLPAVTKALDNYFSKINNQKIIGVTGSMLPPAIGHNDVDFNIGGTVAAINAFSSLRSEKSGVVFAQFHGRVFMGDALDELDLHIQSHNPRLSGLLSIVT